MGLDPKKDPGPMQITVAFIKHNVEKLLPIIHNIMNRTLEHGIIPAEWKKSFIIPIPKKGSKTDVKNYRGIAIQSVFPKIFDKLITSKIYHHLHSVIPFQQHGFMKNRSTTSNLLEITQFIHQNIARKNQVDVIYFDFSKAFDVLDHFKSAIKNGL